MLNQIDELEKQMGELIEQLQTRENSRNALALDNDDLLQAINEALVSLEQPKMNSGSDYEDKRTREEVCDDVIEILERVAERDNDIPF